MPDAKSRDEILAQARTPAIDGLSSEPSAVARAVRSFVDDGQVEPALELVARAWRVWTSGGAVEEGAAAAGAALEASRGAGGVWRRRALYADGVIAFRAGDGERSRRRNEELLDAARSSDDVRGECDALTGLARLALRAGDYDSVVELATRARQKARAAGDVAAEAAPLHLAAAGVRLQQRYDDARLLYLESLALNESLGAKAFVAMETHNLGWVELHRGDAVAAARWFEERNAMSTPDAYGDAWAELNSAALATARGEGAEARRRFEAGAATLERLGVALDPDDSFEFTWLREQLDASAC